MKKKKIILGSSSKFRRSLFSTLNIDFTCISPDINESRLENEKPCDARRGVFLWLKSSDDGALNR